MKISLTVTVMLLFSLGYAQIDKEQLALKVSKADEANTQKLKEYIWKRHSTVTVSGEVKATIINEFSYDETGKLQMKNVGGETSVKKKPGVRGKIQESAIEDKTDYFQKALELSLSYTYMSKGQLLDFFEKATVTEKAGVIEVTGENVYVKGDKLTIFIDAKTNLFISKKFSSLLGKDAIDGEIKYAKFASGINHGSETMINLPAQKAVVTAKNQDYSQRVK
jgi:DNA-binding ferritin-like protein (Dps family)